MPTLHKRSAQDMTRRKSSKKRKEEHDREAEIKAMVALMPNRPVSASDTTEKSTKRESKKAVGGLKRNREDHSSDNSLPLGDSIDSSLSASSVRPTAYKVSAFDALAPRPTIRYSENPRFAPGATLERSDSRRRRLSERAAIPEETSKTRRRIDDLADDLDAGEIRKLMERDQKRRENKLIAERLKTEKKLARRQEKQREVEAIAKREGTPSPDIMERGVLGRDVVGLGIGTSAIVTSSKRKGSISSESGRAKRPAESFRQDSATSGRNPFEDFHRSPSLRTENLTPDSEQSDPVIEVAQFGTVGKASVSPPPSPTTRAHQRGASSISQMMDLAKSNTAPTAASAAPPTPIAPVAPVAPVAPAALAKPELGKQGSETATRTPSAWASFFRRSNKPKRVATPPSFSNTSRDSMQNGQGPLIGYTPVKSTSNIPKRTMSKFREDLPELPISPPDSRVQSPEADVVPPIRRDFLDKRLGSGTDDPRVRYDTPTSGYRSVETGRLRGETPTSRSTDAPSPEPVAVLSQSLASIDSEGSWLSGGKGGSKRGSAQLPSHPLRDSASSLNKRYKEYSESNEELGIAEDEYFSRLTPGPDEQNMIKRQSTGAPMPSSDEEDGGNLASPVGSEKTKWGAVARHPTVVHREPRAKSREGLLNEYDDSGSEPPGESPIDMHPESYAALEDMGEGSGVHRATSVDLGKRHARHISAGSARLLELKAKASGEKRMSGLSTDPERA
jgi:hypothetical protein